MNTGKIKVFGVAILLILGVVISCTRNIAVPVSPSLLPTNTPNVPTNTATNSPTNSPSNSPTNNPTNTPTNSPTNSPTNTPTNTPNGPTNTATNSPTITPTNTPSNTATMSPTNTPTNSPTVNPNSIADFAGGSMTDDTNFNLTGSSYAVTSTGTTGVTAVLTGGTGCAAGASGNFASIGGTIGNTPPTFAQFQTDFKASTAMYDINTNAPGMNAFVYCIKSTQTTQVWFMVSDAATTQSSANCGVFVPVTTSWQSVTVCFNHMQTPNWAPASIAGQVLDPTQVFSAAWQVTTAGAAYDIEIANFQFANVACPAFTATPTIDPNLIDDFESGGAGNGKIDPGPTGTWNGSWFTTNDGSSPMSPVTGTWAKATSPGDGSTYAAHVTCGPVTQNASFGLNFMATPAPYNLSGYTGIVFDVKADVGSGTEMAVAFPDNDTAPPAQGGSCGVSCNGYHQANICMSTSWQSVTVFFSQLSQPSWAPPVAFNSSQVIGIAFNFPVSTNMGVWVDNVKLTTAAAPAPLGANSISDFDFNSGGTSVNPNLTNYPAAGSKGFQTTVPTAAPVNGIMMSPFVICGSGDASNFSGAVSCNWNDNASWGTYPSAQLQVFLMPTPSGGVTTYYNLPSGLTGIQFNWNVLMNSTTGATKAGINLHYNNGNIDGTAQYGICTSGCWDDYSVVLPNTSGGGWTLQSVPFSSMKQGYGSTTVPADPCEPGGGAANAAFPYAGGCYNNTTIGFSWSAQSGNVTGNYTTYFEVDNVTFY